MHKYCSSVLLLKTFHLRFAYANNAAFLHHPSRTVCTNRLQLERKYCCFFLVRLLLFLSCFPFSSPRFFSPRGILATYNIASPLSLAFLLYLTLTPSNRCRSLSVYLSHVYKSKMKSLRMKMWMPNPLFVALVECFFSTIHALFVAAKLKIHQKNGSVTS